MQWIRYFRSLKKRLHAARAKTHHPKSCVARPTSLDVPVATGEVNVSEKEHPKRSDGLLKSHGFGRTHPALLVAH